MLGFTFGVYSFFVGNNSPYFVTFVWVCLGALPFISAAISMWLRTSLRNKTIKKATHYVLASRYDLDKAIERLRRQAQSQYRVKSNKEMKCSTILREACEVGDAKVKVEI